MLPIATDQPRYFPQPEPSKGTPPPCPYKLGFHFHATPHQPPPAFWPHRTLPPCDEDHFKSMTRLEAVLLHPPRDAQRYSFRQRNNKQTPVKLKIVKILGGTYERDDAYVVVCETSQADGSSGSSSYQGGQLPHLVVVKIYDPMYYEALIYRHESFGVSVMDKADGDYSREGAVYEKLSERHCNGTTEGAQTFTPTYYGSWTFDTEVVPPHGCRGGLELTTHRPVRILIMEYVDGPALDRLDAALRKSIDPSEDFRMAVWARVLDAQTRLAARSIEHGDEALRNIVMTPCPVITIQSGVILTETGSYSGQDDVPPPPPLRIVEIDFERSDVVSPTDIAVDALGRPESPIDREWYLESCETAVGLLQSWPAEWYFTDRLRRRRWLARMFGGDKAGEYQPTKHDLSGLPEGS